jgi:PAS domain S-box-containing protein
MRKRGLFFRILAIVAGVEFFVTIVLQRSGMPDGLGKNFLDILLLSVASAPLLYLFVVRRVSRSFAGQAALDRQLREKELALELVEKERDAGARLHSLIQNIPGIVYRGHPDWSVSFIGGEVEPLTGYSAEDFLSRAVRWKEIIHPDDLESVREAYRSATRAGRRNLRVEYRIRHRDGSARWIADRRQFLYDERGEFLHVDGLVLDITHRKRGDEALREAAAAAQREKAKSDAIIAAIGDGISIHDRDFRILYQNDLLKKLFGDHTGEYCYRVYEERDEVCSGCPVVRAFRDGGIHTAERKVDRNGETLYVENTASPLRDPEGNIIAGIEVVRDITQRRKEEKDRIRLAMAVEQSNETIMIMDMEGSIQYVNPAFERLTGYTRGEAIGRNPRFLSSGRHDEAFYREIRETLGRGEIWTGRIVNRKKNGELFEEDATISPVRDQSGRIINYLAAKRDITRLVSLEKQVHTAQRMESVGTLAGGIAHDFNNALTGILGFGEMLKARLAGDPKGAADLDQILRSAERASTLTRQLLTFARRQVIEPRNVSVNHIVADISTLLRKVIGEHIGIETVLQERLPCVFADPGQMEQVLMNLCINARDAMPSGGRLRIETGIEEIDREQLARRPYLKVGRHVRLTVSDTGFGMDETTRERAFEPFFTTKEPGKGTGLGLSVVYGIVKQHGGFIHLESAPGEGASFEILLSAVDAEPDAKAAGGTAHARGGMETILIAEDDDAVRALAALTLAPYGYKVLVARDGDEAVEVFRANGEVDLALLDVIMPGKGGKEALDAMRRTKPDLRAIFTSGYAADGICGSFALPDGVPFLQKPFGPDALARKVREVLDRPAP